MEEIKQTFDDLIALYEKELYERKLDLNVCFIEMKEQCEKLKEMRNRYRKSVCFEDTATHII